MLWESLSHHKTSIILLTLAVHVDYLEIMSVSFFEAGGICHIYPSGRKLITGKVETGVENSYIKMLSAASENRMI